MLFEIGVLGAGLLLLYFGSESLVKGASSSAVMLCVKPVIIGLTVVAFATSAPELLVSLVAAMEGSSGISIGNVLGSNVINIALVLGISSLIKPVTINRQIIRFDLPYLLFTSLVFWFLCQDGVIGRVDGIVLIVILCIFLGLGLLNSKDINPSTLHPDRGLKNIFFNIVLIIMGIIGLALGADMVVRSSLVLARNIGLSETFIGISIVALGTSLPELATSAVASSKGESDISVGNVVGSNLFNICMVMGSVGILNPLVLDPKLMGFEFPFMVVLTLALFGISKYQKRIDRRTGVCFTILFVGYIMTAYWR